MKVSPQCVELLEARVRAKLEIKVDLYRWTYQSPEIKLPIFGALGSISAKKYLIYSSEDLSGSLMEHSDMVNIEPKSLQNMHGDESNCQDSHEAMPEVESADFLKFSGTIALDNGFMEYGCPHYRLRCRIRAPCCNEIFDCRHCHNEAKNSINVDQKERHDVPRHQVKQVICMLCGTEQEVGQICISCGVCMGRYFCETCKFYDDDTSKSQFHCDGCGICRVGGRDKFFHCDKCGCCYSIFLRDSHPCVERAMHQNCPICFEYLFDSTNNVAVLRCGHTIHANCFKEMQEHSQFACPLCSKSVCDMSELWERIDVALATTSMPESYQDKMVWILCNDCGCSSEVKFHFVGHKCPHCRSYNTRQTRG